MILAGQKKRRTLKRKGYKTEEMREKEKEMIATNVCTWKCSVSSVMGRGVR